VKVDKLFDRVILICSQAYIWFGSSASEEGSKLVLIDPDHSGILARFYFSAGAACLCDLMYLRQRILAQARKIAIFSGGPAFRKFSTRAWGSCWSASGHAHGRAASRVSALLFYRVGCLRRAEPRA